METTRDAKSKIITKVRWIQNVWIHLLRVMYKFVYTTTKLKYQSGTLHRIYRNKQMNWELIVSLLCLRTLICIQATLPIPAPHSQRQTLQFSIQNIVYTKIVRCIQAFYES